MTSAVPYEPDDFDNNPFAEQSVIFSPERPVEAPPAETAAGAQEQPQTEEGSNEAELKKPFHDDPTKQDIRRYIPERLNRNDFSIVIKVREVENNGKLAQTNPVIRFDAQVKNIPGFRKHAYKDVRRTYKEIESFYKYLIYNNIEVFVPALLQVTPAFMAMSPEFVDSVTRNVQEWFNRISHNSILIRNQEFVLFFEQNDFSYTPSKTKPSNNSVMATGLKRKTLKQLQPPYDASQELAEYRPMIKEFHQLSERLVDRLDKLVKLQKQSSDSTIEFHSKMSKVAPIRANINSEASKLWEKTEKVMQVFSDMSLVGNVMLNASLAECFQLISDDCYNIKEALTNRHLLMRELINAEENTRKRQMTIGRLKAKSIIDPVKIDEAIRSLELANNYEKELRYEVKRTTYEMLLESREYTKYLTALLQKTFKAIALYQIQHERKKLHLLTTNKVVNPVDSLGRLGRESQAVYSPEASPTKTGDSWNARPKKRDSINGPESAKTPDDISSVDAKSAASLLAGSSF